MACSIHLPGRRSCRLADNKPSWKNQRRCFLCPFNHSNEPLHSSTPHSDAILSYSREWWSSIVAEFNIIEADQGNIVWNAQPLLCERAKDTDRHEIASGNDSGKVAALAQKDPGRLVGLIDIPARLTHQTSVWSNPHLRQGLLASEQTLEAGKINGRPGQEGNAPVAES